MNIQGWFPLRLIGLISLLVQGTLKSLLQHHSLKAPVLWHLAFFIVQFSHPYMATRKTIALTRWTFVSKAMSLLFKILSRFDIAILPRNKRLLILWLQSLSELILEPKKMKSDTVYTFSPSICHEVMRPYATILVYWVLSQLFHCPLSPSSRDSLVPLHFLPLGWCYLHVLLLFLPAILIPACASYSQVNKQCDNIQPWHVPFPIWNQSIVPCLVLTVASWPAHRFLRRQVKWSGIPISLRIFHNLLWSTQSKAFHSQWSRNWCFWNSFAFSMTQCMLVIWSLIPLPFLNPAWTSGSSRFTYWGSLV